MIQYTLFFAVLRGFAEEAVLIGPVGWSSDEEKRDFAWRSKFNIFFGMLFNF